MAGGQCEQCPAQLWLTEQQPRPRASQRGDGGVGAMNLWSFCPRGHTHLAASECHLLTQGEIVMARNAGKGPLGKRYKLIRWHVGCPTSKPPRHLHSRSSLGQQVKWVSLPSHPRAPWTLSLWLLSPWDLCSPAFTELLLWRNALRKPGAAGSMLSREQRKCQRCSIGDTDSDGTQGHLGVLFFYKHV